MYILNIYNFKNRKSENKILLYGLIIILEWIVIEFNSINLKFIILIDWISILFIRFIILISSIIILYRIMYISLEKYINRFNYLFLLFIL